MLNAKCRTRSQLLRASLTSCVLLCARTAHASPLLDLTGDTTGMGGLQAGTVPGGSGAAYFNPALLLEVDPGLTVGFMILTQQVGISLDGRPGTEFAIPNNIANAGHANGDRFDNYPIPTNLLQNGRSASSLQGFLAARPRQAAGSGHETFTYDVVGLVVKLFDQRLAIGFHGLVPNGQFTKLRAFFNDEREQYFSNSLQAELYSDRMTALSLGLGVGYQLTKALSLGIGATISLAANVGAPTYVVDTGNLGKILIDIDAGVNISVAPHLGLDYKVSDRLRITATAHAPERVELGTSFKFLLANGVEQQSGVSLVHDYTPWQFGLGATYDLVSEPNQVLSLAGTLSYVRWSDYLDRHGANPSGAYTWLDTIAPTVGARYRWQKLRTSFDLSYAPSPVPLQTGRTNYVDNDRLSAAAGVEYAFRVSTTAMRVGAQLQAHRLIERHQTKLPTPTRADGTNLAPQLVKDEVPDDAQLSGTPLVGASGLQTNNPGWPGFGSEGWILAGSVYFAVAF